MIYRLGIRTLRLIELLTIFPIVIIIMTIIDRKLPKTEIKKMFTEWCLWFKNATDYKYY